MEEVKSIEARKWVVGIIVMEEDYKDQIEREENYQLICKMLASEGMHVKYVRPVFSTYDDLQEALIGMVDELKVDLILSLGGVGLRKQDNVPELTAGMIDLEVPIILEAFRYYGLQEHIREAMCRGVSGMRRRTLVINLPAQISKVKKALEPTMALIKQSLEGINE